jgi:hypothetical protein
VKVFGDLRGKVSITGVWRSQWSGELNADLGRLSPNYAAVTDRIRIKPKFKRVRNADRAKYLETSAAVRDIANHAVDSRATMRKHDLRSLQDPPAVSLSARLSNRGRRR